MAKPPKQASTRTAAIKATSPVLLPSLPLAELGAEPQGLPTQRPEALLNPALPRWKRGHDSRMRKRVARILVLKMAGKSTAQIAKRLETTPDTVRHYLYIAGKNGWLASDGLELVDPSETLAFESAHKIVRNINSALDGTVLKDQQFEMTKEAAKGIGLFKQHSATKVEGTIAIPMLEVRFELPRGSVPFVPPVAESMGGVGAYVDGQVVGDQQQLPAPAEESEV